METSKDKTVEPFADNSLKIIDNRTGKAYTIPISEDNTISAADIREMALVNNAPIMLFDPGLVNTAVLRSSISYVDGEAGRLFYRGYSIETLVENSTFLEVAYLLIYGQLPTPSQYNDWHTQVMTHTFVHVRLDELMRSFNYDAHPMGMFISSMAAMSTFHPEANPSLAGLSVLNDRAAQNKQIKRILGKVTTVAANAYRHRIGRAFNSPRSEMSYAENFLFMLDALGDYPNFKPHPVLVQALDKLFIIHAEHEMNCSTATLRHVASTRVDPYSAVAAAAAALYGPLHGGATEAVIRMLSDVGTVENVPEFLESVKRKEKKLMGFGHRVYKSYDPRAILVRKILDDVFEVCGKEPLMKVALALESLALKDSYFVDRKLYPNVDFYTGLIYKAMGFPPDFFPLLFAIPRTAGWLAHWREQIETSDDESAKIWRPRQVYAGEPEREYVKREMRSETLHGENVTSSKSYAMYKRYNISIRHESMS